MNRTAIVATTVLAAAALPVLAGGDPDYVGFPQDYAASFTHYATLNRSNGTQVAMMYANDVALESHRAGEAAASGAVIVMEIYPAVLDADEEAVVGADGLFEHKDLAAIAVMEKSDAWPYEFAADTRAGDWAFALYDTQGMAKANDLECYTCHVPLEDQDNMFSYQYLRDHVAGY